MEEMDSRTQPEAPIEFSAAQVELMRQYLKDYPNTVLKRILALRHLQLETNKLEAEFCDQMYELEKTYRAKQRPLFEMRKKIVTGECEPTEAQCAVVDNDHFMTTVMDELEQSKIDPATAVGAGSKLAKGIPEFWLNVFRNRDLIAETINENDEKALASLEDVEIKYMNDTPGFIIYFHFGPNEFFTNNVLTKEYKMSSKLDPERPFLFNGTDIVGRKGCAINWLPNKNLTVRTRHVRSKQTHSKVIKETPVDSFFNFFDMSIDHDNAERLDAEGEALLEIDYEIAQVIRDEVIPHAVLVFTGEMAEPNDLDDEEESEGAYESDDDDD